MKILSFALLFSIMIGAISCGCSDTSEQSSISADSTADSIASPIAPTIVENNEIVHTIPVYIPLKPLRTLFNDMNEVHLEAAIAGGIEPIANIKDAYNLKTPIQKIATCENYTVENLSHSMPYLVPKAAKLLDRIGQRFADTIRARGGHEYRIKVTSVLRTDYTVAKLRRRNINATENSAHCYGTTFDISYSKFICKDSTFIVSQADLKNILGEILYDEKQKGSCFVKFERKQGCFHITAR